MSEELKPQNNDVLSPEGSVYPEPIPLQDDSEVAGQENLPPWIDLSAEAGGINIDEISNNLVEYAERASSTVLTAYYGLRAAISRRSMRKAGDRLERMDHKDALYSDMAQIALRRHLSTPPETATGEQARPRTFAERFLDRRADKRQEEADRARTYAYRTEKIYGPKDQLPGLTKKQRKQQQAQVSRLTRRGELTAREARIEKLKIGAKPVKLGYEEHKRTSSALNKTSSRLERTVNQPILSRWRNFRRQRAIGRIKDSHRDAEEYESIKRAIAEREPYNSTR